MFVSFKFRKVLKSMPHWDNNAHFYEVTKTHYFMLYPSHKTSNSKEMTSSVRSILSIDKKTSQMEEINEIRV